MTTEPIISLDLLVSQVNIILMALNEAPYRVSAPLIASIVEQASVGQNASAHSPATVTP